MAILKAGAPMNIANGIREFARASPGVTAVIDGDRTLTYSALDERSNRLANLLLTQGLDAGDRVAFFSGNRLEYPEVAAGVAKAGMIMVPLNPRSTPNEVEFILGHSRSRALILDDSLAEGAALAIDSHGLENVFSIAGATLGRSYDAALERTATTDPQRLIDEMEPFTIAYTSGTTGVAKGVMISHRSRCLIFFCTALEWGEFARASPGVTAVIDGDRTLTYSALDERSNRLANLLLTQGLDAGDRVAFFSGNRLEYPEVAAGVAKAGMIMVPLNPRSTPNEVEFILGHSRSRALILDDSLAEGAALAIDSHGLENVFSIAGATLGRSYDAALERTATTDPQRLIDEMEPFTIAYTSGTTGVAKGVMISHRSRCLIFFCTALEWGLGPGRRTIAVAPMYHGAGFAFAYAALHTGGTVSMLHAFDPERFLAMVERDKAQTVFLIPTHARLIRDLGEVAISRYDLSSLETMYFNAAALPQELKLWILATFPHVGLHELYGSTEAAVVTNLRPEHQLRKEQCVGPPWFMNEVRLVDDEGNPVPTGTPGELYSRSPFLMNGYFDDPEATAAATSDDGFFSAGDIAIMDDENFIYIVDRKKDVIITGGVNVYPREVEEVLIRHTLVQDVAVVGTPSAKWGEAVTAVLVIAPNTPVPTEELDALCRSLLAGHKVPRRYEVVDELPRNAAGKTLKRELREQLASSTSAEEEP